MIDNFKVKFPILLTVLMLVWIDLGACSQSGVKVIVTNQGTKPITNLQVLFSGGSENSQKLGPGTTHEFTVNPAGESSIDLRFVDADGSLQTIKLDVYLGKNYEGALDVQIASDGTVKWREVASPRPRSFGIF